MCVVCDQNKVEPFYQIGSTVQHGTPICEYCKDVISEEEYRKIDDEYNGELPF